MAHSTGSNIGDPLEVQALTNVFSKYTKQKQFCMISSIKPLIGHTFAASGTVALISMLMAMKTRSSRLLITVNRKTRIFRLKKARLCFAKKTVHGSGIIRSRGWERSARRESAAPMRMQSLKNTSKMISRSRSGVMSHRRSSCFQPKTTIGFRMLPAA